MYLLFLLCFRAQFVLRENILWAKFEIVLDWKIYMIFSFAHLRSRWIETWEWFLNSYNLINIFFTCLLFGCQEKLGENKICSLVSVSVFLCFRAQFVLRKNVFWGKFEIVLDWKIYMIFSFARLRSRWIETWEWFLNSYNLITIFFYLSFVWLPRKFSRK